MSCRSRRLTGRMKSGKGRTPRKPWGLMRLCGRQLLHWVEDPNIPWSITSRSTRGRWTRRTGTTRSAGGCLSRRCSPAASRHRIR